MLKFLTLALIGWLVYRFWWKPQLSRGNDDSPKINDSPEDEGEYIDYEEVD